MLIIKRMNLLYQMQSMTRYAKISLQIGMTLEELGNMLGVSKERVRQIEHRALIKLKQSLQSSTESHKDLLESSLV